MAESRQVQINHQQWINRVWYGRSLISWLLFPLSALFWLIISIRKWIYLFIPGFQKQFSVPIIVVGNITVGGTGKTPMVIAICEDLKNFGYKPGVVSRGYGSKVTNPVSLQVFHNPDEVGDEPIIIARRAQVPVVVCAKRKSAIDKLIQEHQCNVIICDDGLQDYRFLHDIEIAMVDGDRKFGNERLLPAGPLREKINRLSKCDFIVATAKALPELSGDCMEFQVQPLVNLVDPTKQESIEIFKGKTVHAIAGIANPMRFFELLRKHDVIVIEHAYPDHAKYQPEKLLFTDKFPVLLTEKDAVKCTNFNIENAWYLPVIAQLPDTFMQRVESLLRGRNG